MRCDASHHERKRNFNLISRQADDENYWKKKKSVLHFKLENHPIAEFMLQTKTKVESHIHMIAHLKTSRFTSACMENVFFLFCIQHALHSGLCMSLAHWSWTQGKRSSAGEFSIVIQTPKSFLEEIFHHVVKNSKRVSTSFKKLSDVKFVTPHKHKSWRRRSWKSFNPFPLI